MVTSPSVIMMLLSDFKPFEASALWFILIVAPLILMSLSEEMPCFLLAFMTREPNPLMLVVPLELMTALPSLSSLSLRIFVVPFAMMIFLSTFLERFNGTFVSDVISALFRITSYGISLSSEKEPLVVVPLR